ncbi:MAG: sarcosine oxidase subunit beta, partial [Gammaproteobacteria bacterium]
GSGWVFAHTIAHNKAHELNKDFTLERFREGYLLDEKGVGASPKAH